VFDIGGLAVGQYSLLQINGAATFGGSLTALLTVVDAFSL
jgi:hypothetical protein